MSGMNTTQRRSFNVLLGLVPIGVALLVASSADAQERYERDGPAGPVRYPVEVEVHAAFGAENVYGGTAYGAGVRVSIPLAAGWLGRNVSDDIAISFGGDVLNYQNCYYADRCGANYLMLPVAAQWNVFFGRRFSIFGEAGVFFYKGFFDGCGPGNSGCDAPNDIGLLPTLAIGARVMVAPRLALLARVGYPTTTLGLTFL